MARVLALDFGKARCGLAISDPLRMIANGLDTVERRNLDVALDKLLVDQEIDTLVVGEPKRHNGQPSDVEKDIAAFLSKFAERHSKLNIERMDERFTSKLAMDAMITMGTTKKQRRNKGTIDKMSATLILQDYLNK